MARGKKKESLTPEERLQAALVPESEQPYKVPENWCWVRLTSLKNGDNGFFDGDWILSENMDPTGDIRLLQLSDIGIGEFLDKSNKHINEKTFKQLACSELNEGDIMISRMAEPIARSCIVPKFPYKVITAVDVAVLRCNSHFVIDQYINYICNTKWFTDLAFKLARGTTRVRITRKNLGEMPIPLPPLTEQQRIVDRIESLFAKLDEAKQKAQEALDSFEARKAAILHKAFTGELTAQWRKEHGVGMESWSWIPLKKCGSWNGGGTPSMSHPEYWENGTLLWVTSKDMKSDLIEDTLMHTNMLGVENSSATYIEEPAVLFVMRSGILRRIFPVCMVKKPFTVNQDLKALVPTVDINLEYLFWACKANEKQILEKCMKSGTTVESINTAALRDFEIPIARKHEQTEIVHILDDLLAKEQQAKEAAEGVLEQIDLIKKAILARAFRGELGTNDPSEESAVKLLCSWD